MRLETSIMNPRKREPRPFALHFPNVMGDISEKEFERVIKEILWQFWVNEKVRSRGVRAKHTHRSFS